MKKSNFSIFLTCLLLATLFWFLNIFTKNYDSLINVPVRYVNLPKNKAVLNELPQNINIEVSAYGFYLLTHRISQKADTIEIDGSLIQERTSGFPKNYIPTRSLVNRFTEQFGTAVKVKNVLTDTIFFQFDKISTKKLPVKTNLSYTLEKQYLLEGPILIKPSLVKVTGPASVVDTLKSVTTEYAEFHNLKEPVATELSFAVANENKYVTVSPEKVSVKIPVGKFTESTISVPVAVENVPKRLSVKTFPDHVSITYFVPFSQYEKVSAELFSVTVDYNDIAKEKKTKLKVRISKSPDFVNVVKVSPEKVEYIVKK
jgi:hypothetical protein